MKGYLRKFLACICVIALSISLCPACFAQGYAERTVAVTRNGQIVDSFMGVDCKYVAYSSNTGYYCCASYVSRFYNEVFGVTVYDINTADSKPNVYLSGHKAELCAVKNPKAGDIMQYKDYTHVGIVKAVNGSEVTLIEQNYKYNDSETGELVTVVNRRCEASECYFYRLCVDGEMQTLDADKDTVSGTVCRSFSACAKLLGNCGRLISRIIKNGFG